MRPYCWSDNLQRVNSTHSRRVRFSCYAAQHGPLLHRIHNASPPFKITNNYTDKFNFRRAVMEINPGDVEYMSRVVVMETRLIRIDLEFLPLFPW